MWIINNVCSPVCIFKDADYIYPRVPTASELLSSQFYLSAIFRDTAFRFLLSFRPCNINDYNNEMIIVHIHITKPDFTGLLIKIFTYC